MASEEAQSFRREVGPIRFVQVWGTFHEKSWDTTIAQHHYLGKVQPSGHRLKYLIYRADRLVAALMWSAGSLKLRDRDHYIGWDAEQRKRHLHRVINNSRFVLIPGESVKNLGSHILAKSLKVVVKDWQKHFGYSPWLAETFVDGSLFRGSVYKASNWLHIGKTSGYGKGRWYHHHGKIKEVYIYELNRRFREKIGCKAQPYNPFYSPPKHQQHREEQRMIIRDHDWRPTQNPVLDWDDKDFENMAEELLDFHDIFSECYNRKEQESLGLTYLSGLLSPLPRKSVEPIALRLSAEQNVRGMQRFLKSYKWDDEMMKRLNFEHLMRLIGEPEGMLTVDSSEFAKKGKESVGVGRQYCGTMGKVENCQSGVFLGYTSTKGYGLLDSRLYMPKHWFGDDYSERRKFNKVPEDLDFKTKPEIASNLLAVAIKQGIPAKWIGCDASFGSDFAFLESIPENFYYFANVRSNFRVFLKEPTMVVPPHKGPGQKAKLPRVLSDEKPVTLQEISQSGLLTWEPAILGEGAKGPIFTEMAFLRILPSYNGIPRGKWQWLVVRRHSNGELKFAISNAPMDISRVELAKIATMRWPIEQCFEDGKSVLGMGQYEHRSWPAWHRHMTFVFLGLHLLLRLRLKSKKKTMLLTLPQACLLLSIVLPLRVLDREHAMMIVRYHIKRNHIAYRSHRKKALGKFLARRFQKYPLLNTCTASEG